MFFLFFMSLQLGNLERKWQHHEQNNFVMKECILCSLLFAEHYFHLAWLECILLINPLGPNSDSIWGGGGGEAGLVIGLQPFKKIIIIIEQTTEQYP